MLFIEVLSLYRYAIKGLSGDPLLTIQNLEPSDVFPDDRRFALLKEKGNKLVFDEENPQWLHKENFLCAFTSPSLMSTFDTQYHTSPEKDEKILTIWKRNMDNLDLSRKNPPLLPPIDVSKEENRNKVSEFFTSACGEPVKFVFSQKTHQFGNTRSGVKKQDDTRTLHIVNAATIRHVSEKIQIPLDARRFRPNIVVDSEKLWSKPFEEFNCIGKSLFCEKTGMVIEIISKTVRCDGICIDPYDTSLLRTKTSTIDGELVQKKEFTPLDIPKLLTTHFPEHGPYLGVYAIIKEGGSISVGDKFTLLD